MKKVILVIFLLYLLIGTKAQNQLIGIVTNMDINPLVGATIFLPELHKGTTSNLDGEFLISNLPIGTLNVQFSFVGYNKVLKTIQITSGQNELNVALDVAVIQSQEVVISGGYVSSQHENAVKIDVLRSSDILLAGTPNLMESLTQIPGVDMISKGPGVSKPVIRGLSMNNILVLNNGVRIENYQYSENHPLGIDENNIERVEIIKGPASLFHGSDALGGVLNFIKEYPAPTGKLLGDYKMQLYSNTLGLNTSLGLKGATKDVFGGFRVGYKTNADYLQGGKAFVPNTRFKELTFNVNTGYTGESGVFKLFYDYFQQDLGMCVPPSVALINERGRKNDIWYQDLKHHLISSQNNLYFGRFKWRINVAYQNALRKLRTTTDLPFVEMNLNTISYESKLYLPSSDRSEFVFGIQGMAQYNRNLNNRESQFLPDANISNLGFIGMAKYMVSENFQLQGGLRFDANSTETFTLGQVGTSSYQAPVNKSYSSFSGSFGMTYSPISKIHLRANFGRAYRVPNLSELTSNGMHGNRYEVGNANLTPQYAYETDVSIHYHGKNFSFDLDVFYNIIDDYIFISPTVDTTTSGDPVYHYSHSNATLFGGEAGIHLHPKAAPWLHMKSTYASVTGKQENGDYLPYIPANKLHYEIRGGREKLGFFIKPYIKLSALTAFSQANPSPYETPTEAYTLVNLSVYSEFHISEQTVIFEISVNNIFDKQYFDHLSTLKPLQFYNQGRNISVFLKVPFTII